MWPTAEMLTSDTEVNSGDEKLSPLLEQFIENEKLIANLSHLLKRFICTG